MGKMKARYFNRLVISSRTIYTTSDACVRSVSFRNFTVAHVSLNITDVDPYLKWQWPFAEFSL